MMAGELRIGGMFIFIILMTTFFSGPSRQGDFKLVIGENELNREWFPPFEGVNFQIPLQRIENFEGVSSVRRSLFDRQPKLHNYNRLSVVSNYTFPEILEDEDDDRGDDICRGKTLKECIKVTRDNSVFISFDTIDDFFKIDLKMELYNLAGTRDFC